MNDLDTPKCRICYKINSSYKEPLIPAPCDCKGSIGFVHIDCLKHNIEYQKKTKCEICHKEFIQLQEDSTIEIEEKPVSNINTTTIANTNTNPMHNPIHNPKPKKKIRKGYINLTAFFLSVAIYVFIMIYVGVFLKADYANNLQNMKDDFSQYTRDIENLRQTANCTFDKVELETKKIFGIEHYHGKGILKYNYLDNQQTHLLTFYDFKFTTDKKEQTDFIDYFKNKYKEYPDGTSLVSPIYECNIDPADTTTNLKICTNLDVDFYQKYAGCFEKYPSRYWDSKKEHLKKEKENMKNGFGGEFEGEFNDVYGIWSGFLLCYGIVGGFGTIIKTKILHSILHRILSHWFEIVR